MTCSRPGSPRVTQPRTHRPARPSVGRVDSDTPCRIAACRLVRLALRRTREPVADRAGVVVSIVRSSSLVVVGTPGLARATVAGLMVATLVPTGVRLRNRSGAFVLVGLPWLAFVAASASHSVGRFDLYGAGNDFWMFQRYAYRIVMQGYWLEGGSPTFWFQPLYRWIAGAAACDLRRLERRRVVLGRRVPADRIAAAFCRVKRVAAFRWALAASFSRWRSSCSARRGI